MTKKPPDLPNIEDATLRACLAPLMDAMQAGVEPMGRPSPLAAPRPTRVPDQPAAGSGMAGVRLFPPVGTPASGPAALAEKTPSGSRENARVGPPDSPDAEAPADVVAGTSRGTSAGPASSDASEPETGAPANTPAVPPMAAPAGSHRGSNDNPSPSGEPIGAGDRDYMGTPRTLAEWRALADDEFGAFRTIELFLAMTDAELRVAAAEFPRQIGGTLARIGRIKRRLAAQYDTVTTAAALLERALARATAEHGDH